MTKQSLTKEDREAEHRPCIRCGKPGETRNAHYCGYRSYAYGKGRSTKGSRVAMAEVCQDCDDYLSEANYGHWKGGSKNIERSEEFLHFCIMTLIRRDHERLDSS